MHRPFDLTRAESLEEALGLTAAGAVPFAGGTSLLVEMRAGTTTPDHLVAVGDLTELRGIRVEDNRIVLASGATVSDLLVSEVIASEAKSLAQSARRFGGLMVRNAATVAGNIASGSPAADLTPPLLALDSDVTLASAQNRRTVPLHGFFTDYKQDLRRPDELVVEVSWPRRSGADNFYKLARRQGDAITVVGVAVAMRREDGVCRDPRIALGAVDPYVHRAEEAESVLEGKEVTPSLLDRAAEAVVCAPIDDIRASAAYRRHEARVIVRRLLERTWEECP